MASSLILLLKEKVIGMFLKLPSYQKKLTVIVLSLSATIVVAFSIFDDISVSFTCSITANFCLARLMRAFTALRLPVSVRDWQNDQCCDQPVPG